MKNVLVLIHGPISVGKKTVGEKVAKELAAHFFHNHITVNVSKEFFDYNDPQHKVMNRRLREEILKILLTSKKDIVMTSAYADQEGANEHIELMAKMAKENDFLLLGVKLSASHKELLNRVQNEDRKAHNKLTDPDALDILLKGSIFENNIPHAHATLHFDTEIYSPEYVTEQILKRINLLRITY